jgi:hypothetical protein
MIGDRVKKTGGNYTHTGTVVAEFTTTSGAARIVIEFDAPVQGMLFILRPDQVVENAAGSHAESLRQTIREQAAEIERLRSLIPPPGSIIDTTA